MVNTYGKRWTMKVYSVRLNEAEKNFLAKLKWAYRCDSDSDTFHVIFRLAMAAGPEELEMERFERFKEAVT